MCIGMPYITNKLLLPFFQFMIMKLARSKMVVNHVLSMALTLIILSLEPIVAQVGICYGMAGNNLPPKPDGVALCKQYAIDKMRLFDPNPEMLQALKGSQINVAMDVPNKDVQKLASSQAEADNWVKTNIKNYRPNVRFRYIIVGNIGIQPQFVLPAMQNLLNAISSSELKYQIKVTTAINTNLLVGESLPPSKGMFKADKNSSIVSITKFLLANGSPLFVNVNPYLSYIDSKGKKSLHYALFQSQGVVVKDGPLGYKNLFDATIDTFYWALEKIGMGSLEIVVSGTGWPTSGGKEATLKNQKSYIYGLIKHVYFGGGTPKKPKMHGKYLEVYIFAMFDENQRTGPDYEKNWGLFTPDKHIKNNYTFTLG